MLVQGIKDMGTTYNVAENTRDLGDDFSFSKNQKVRKNILKARIKNSQGALNKIYKLTKISRRARVLFSGAGFSNATWGHQTSGLSMQKWTKIEVAAANAGGFGKGRCRYTALYVAYGPEGHPFVRIIKELFILWFKLILPMTRNRDPTLQSIEEAWSQIYIKIAEGQQSITLEKCMSKTDGIAAQVVVILYSLGWIPVNYDKWLDPDGNEWILASESTEPFPVMPLIWKILHTYHRKQINKASEHFDGSWLQDTIAWDIVLSKNKTLKNQKKYSELAILETTQAGACWPATRVSDVLNQGGSVCELCWQYSESCFHSFWTCKALKNTEEEAIIESQHLIDELDVNRIVFFNRALVQENELKLNTQYQPLEEYDLQVNLNRLAPPTENASHTEARLYEPAGTRRMGSPSPERHEPKPVLYTAPDWEQDCGVDELLNQFGCTTTNAHTDRLVNQPGRSSMDDPDINIEEEEIEQQTEHDQDPEQVEAGTHEETDHIPINTETPVNNGAYPNGWPSGYYFGDGSVGKYSKYQPITRCGVGVHYVNPHRQPVFDASMPLPGEIQSNNRAEIYALLVAVRHIEYAGKIDFFIDNKPARNTYHKGKHRARLACHADLWSEMFAILERKHIELNVYWMPSHTDKHKEKLEKAPTWMKDWHVAGNKVADELAGAAAELHAVPEEQAKTIIKIYRDLDLIQNRIIAVTKMFPQRKHNKTIHDNIKYKPTYKDQIIEKLESSQHDCVIYGERLYCCGCNSNISIRAEHISEFIESSCLIPGRTMTYAVGEQHTQHTHT